MPDATLVHRIEILERKVESLELLPARMTALESQILQLGEDMRGEFFAVRREMATTVDALRTELIERISQLEERLGERLRSGDEETRRYMRVLHEDVIERISRVQEGPRSRRRKR
jgi:hypothetical protein